MQIINYTSHKIFLHMQVLKFYNFVFKKRCIEIDRLSKIYITEKKLELFSLSSFPPTHPLKKERIEKITKSLLFDFVLPVNKQKNIIFLKN